MWAEPDPTSPIRKVQRSSAFRSQVARIDKSLTGGTKKANRTPGPGTYQIKSNFSMQEHPKHLQNFGSSSKRMAMGKGGAAPGPGLLLAHELVALLSRSVYNTKKHW